MTERVLPTPSRESSSSHEIPPRPIEEITREAVADIDLALDRIRAYGARPLTDSRLHQARAILGHAAETRVLVPKHRGNSLGLRALELAFDYGAIAETLPDQRIAAVRLAL